MSFLLKTFDEYYQHCAPHAVARDTIIAILVIYGLYRLSRQIRSKGFRKTIISAAISTIKYVPGGSMITDSIKNNLRETLIPKEVASLPVNYTLPQQGIDKDKLLSQLKTWSKNEFDNWNNGRASGAIYHGDQAILKVATEAYSCFALSNPLHPELFPYVRKMEAEAIRMTVSLFNGNHECCGQMTSGGTESIIMAVKAYKDQARAERGVTSPELIVCDTVHAAFDKACGYFGIKLITLKSHPITKAFDPSKLTQSITKNTIAVAASAMSFPHGIVDPIEEIAAITRQHNIGLHVDCCLGSFLIPFARDYGVDIPLFDFRVPGVTSISADTHKYGYSPKGSSIVMFRSEKLRQYMYYVTTSWTGGVYASPTIAGSRPGAIVASTWATMMLFGYQGYKDHAFSILRVSDKIRDQLKDINTVITGTTEPSPDDLILVGDSKLSVIALGFRHQIEQYNATNDGNTSSSSFPSSNSKGNLDIYALMSVLSKHSHWHLNSLQRPPSIHLCITYANHKNVEENFINDLTKAVKTLRENPMKYMMNTNTQLYGVAGAIEIDDADGESSSTVESSDSNDRKNNLVGEIAMCYLDTLTFLPPNTEDKKAKYD